MTSEPYSSIQSYNYLFYVFFIVFKYFFPGGFHVWQDTVFWVHFGDEILQMDFISKSSQNVRPI